MQAFLTPAYRDMAYLDKLMATYCSDREPLAVAFARAAGAAAESEEATAAAQAAAAQAAAAAAVAETAARAQAHCNAVVSAITELALQVAEYQQLRAREDASVGTPHLGTGDNPFKRARVTSAVSPATVAAQQQLQALGLMGPAAVAAPAQEQEESLRARVVLQVKRYLDRSLNFAAFKHPLGHDALDFWLDPVTQQEFPLLCVVALVVFGHPSSAAQIERDFSIASLLVTNKRSLLDVAWVDMTLFLRANMDSIPDVRTIPVLDACARGPWYHERVPCRMRSAAEIRATMALSSGAQPLPVSDPSSAGTDDDLEQLAFP
jgi:hypothetical protein